MQIPRGSSQRLAFAAAPGFAFLGLIGVSGSPQREQEYAPLAWVAGFAAADADGDGVLSEDETTAARQWAELLLNIDFGLADADGNGELSRSELGEYARQLVAYGVGRADPETDEQLADLLSLDTLLAALAHRDAYRDEVATLLKELTEASGDDIERVTYIISHPKKYPKIAPLVTRWAWRHPARRSWLPQAIGPRRSYVKPKAPARRPQAVGKPPRRRPGAPPPRSAPKPPRTTKPPRRPR